MTNIEIVRTPAIIAAEINQIISNTRKIVLNNSIEVGKRLCEAKEMVAHGEWAPWLSQNFELSQSTANNMMNIYKEFGAAQGELWGGSVKSQAFEKLSYSQALALLAVPAEEREKFIEENHADEMSTRELAAAIKAKEEAERELEEAKAAAEKEIDKLNEKLDNSNLEKTSLVRAAIEKTTQDVEKKYEAELTKLEEQLEEAQFRPDCENEEKIGELEERLEALKDERDKAVAKAAEAEVAAAKAQPGPSVDITVIRFKVHFDGVNKAYNELLRDIAAMDDDKQAKYKAGIKKMLNVMMEAIEDE